MHLSEYMAAQRLSDDQMAELIGIDRATVSRIRRGRMKPGWGTLAKIKAATEGAVTANDFLPEGNG